MKAGKITAKLRDAVKVCFMVEGEEVKRYKNIEMPDALKELEIRDFAFNVLTDGKIEFWLHFDEGILPTEWPEDRERKTRAAKVETAATEDTMTASESVAAEEADTPGAKIEDAPDVNEPASEVAVATENPEAVEPATEHAEALEADAVSAPAKQPAKRGRKPGSRFGIEHKTVMAQ